MFSYPFSHFRIYIYSKKIFVSYILAGKSYPALPTIRLIFLFRRPRYPLFFSYLDSQSCPISSLWWIWWKKRGIARILMIFLPFLFFFRNFIFFLFFNFSITLDGLPHRLREKSELSRASAVFQGENGCLFFYFFGHLPRGIRF